MAPSGDAKLVFCILFMTCCFKMTQAEIPLDCCLSVKSKMIPKAVAVNYYPQTIGCSINATIIVTRKNKKLCAPFNEPWVEDLKRHVDNLKKHCKKVNYEGKRCHGVKPQ